MMRILFALALLSTAAVADEQAPPPQTPVEQERVAVQAWGKAHPACREWSDSCVVCTQDGCSTPGIACTPTQTACRR
jgi:hypothetical protein